LVLFVLFSFGSEERASGVARLDDAAPYDAPVIARRPVA
jgi:hypothetical protein